MTRDPASEPAVVAERRIGDEIVLLTDTQHAIALSGEPAALYDQGGMSRRRVLQLAAAGAAVAGIAVVKAPPASAAGSTPGTLVLDLLTEVAAYNTSHTTNNAGNSSGQFSYFASAKNKQGGGVSFTTAELTTAALSYIATNGTNGHWGSGTPNTGPFAAGSGVKATPDPTNGGGQQGTADVIRLTIPAAPLSGTYTGAGTITVTAKTPTGTGDWVYVLDGSGNLLVATGVTNPVLVNAGHNTDSRSFALPVGASGQTYFVAIAPISSGASSVVVNVTASLPYLH